MDISCDFNTGDVVGVTMIGVVSVGVDCLCGINAGGLSISLSKSSFM